MAEIIPRVEHFSKKKVIEIIISFDKDYNETIKWKEKKYTFILMTNISMCRKLWTIHLFI